MKWLFALLIAVAGVALGYAIGSRPAPAPGPSWTGPARPEDLIAARQELMAHIEELMQPIDTLTAQPGAVSDVERLHQNAGLIGAMLAAVPHLFPPTTDLYDAGAAEPRTLALPAIWKDFDSFYQLARASREVAERLGTTQGEENLREASRALRSSCDGCHELFLRKYVPAEVLDADRDFDFSKALPP